MTYSTAQNEQVSSKPLTKVSDLQNWYSVPRPIRRIFNQFPLVTYKESPLPQRARRNRGVHELFVFANPLAATGKNLSCNPACLKWQAYLTFHGIDFEVVASNNHASPSGSLPFLLPTSSTTEQTSIPLIANKIPRWVSQQTMQEEEFLQTEHQAYMALVDHNIRNAWLYYLYLDKANFNQVAHPLYVATTSSNKFVQTTIAHQLREAAQAELLKTQPVIDGAELLHSAAKAFRALSVLLDSNQFFGSDGPGLLDASVFAYTYLLLDESLPWENNSLSQILHRHPELIDHRERLLNFFWNN